MLQKLLPNPTYVFYFCYLLGKKYRVLESLLDKVGRSNASLCLTSLEFVLSLFQEILKIILF